MKKNRRRSAPRSSAHSRRSPTRTSIRQRLAGRTEHRHKRRVVGSFKRLKKGVLNLFSRTEIERLARDCGFYVRTARQIHAFEFSLCCALAAAVEDKRGFASVWRLLGSAAGVEVARSAVTQRFGPGSAALLERLFNLVVQRIPTPAHPEQLKKLDEFDHVLADDGSVLALSPLLKKLFPATRTNTMPAAAKLHATADLVHRQILDVVLTGERCSELEVAREKGVIPNTLYVRDLGYTSYDHFLEICLADADFLARLKENANPTVVEVIHGIRAPMRSVGMKLNEVELVKSSNSFAVLVHLKTSREPLLAYVIGLRNPATGKYHRYVTSLPPQLFTPDELATLYALRWVIELLFKLLKSSFHLDHLHTADPDAIRTHIYASLLGSAIFTAVAITAAKSARLPPSAISPLTVGVAAPLLVMPLLLLWLERKVTYDALSGVVLRTVAIGCRDQNPARTRRKWGGLS
jgi:putative transposase